MFKYNIHLSINREMKVFVAGKLFPNQSDDYTAYNPETGEEITWREIRKLAQEYFDEQEPTYFPINEIPVNNPKSLDELLKSGAVQIGNNSKLQERLNKIQKPEADIKPKAILNLNQNNLTPEFKTGIKHSEPLNTKVNTNCLKLNTKVRTGVKNPKYKGIYLINNIPYHSARAAAKEYGKSINTTIKHCIEGINGCAFKAK